MAIGLVGSFPALHITRILGKRKSGGIPAHPIGLPYGLKMFKKDDCVIFSGRNELAGEVLSSCKYIGNTDKIRLDLWRAISRTDL